MISYYGFDTVSFKTVSKVNISQELKNKFSNNFLSFQAIWYCLNFLVFDKFFVKKSPPFLCKTIVFVYL